MITPSVAQRKQDLVDLANFGARTGRKWLVRDALLAMRREGLMVPELAFIVPADVLEDPAVYLAEALRRDDLWVVAWAYDALRLESYGFPALAIEDKLALVLDDLNGCQWIVLLQRPGEEQTLAGLDVRAELLRLGWAGLLTSIILPFIDLDEAEEAVGGETFALWLVSLVLHAHTQRLAGERTSRVNGDIRHGGLRTIAAGEVMSWRR